MVKPAHIQRTRFFYPVGNTPAICLTQSLPPDQDASLLLLGCGDIRNILFTAYAGSGIAKRTLDITCCDIEVEIIARNILLFTMIIDDERGNNSKKIWNIYNDVFLDSDSLNLLRMQTKMLMNAGESLEEWNNGRYGKLLRFCDSSTFAKVTRLWEFYSFVPSDGQLFSKQQQRLRLGIQKARDYQKKIVGQGMVLSGIRSVAPCSTLALKHIPRFYQHYWKNGITALDEISINKATHMNPMYGSLNDSLLLHYGTDPLLGYHLATGFAPLSDNSPLKPELKKKTGLTNGVEAALVQFHAYSDAFRAASAQLTIRFVSADALAFCHVLQHHQTHGESKTACWYRDNWNYEPLILDTSDYNQETSPQRAPLSFDVIDTSNLVDHIGCLNVLAAAAPLLIQRHTSAISTEMLVLREKNIDDYVKGLLCGDLPTVAFLFGLTPVQYWTGATVTSNYDDFVLNMSSSDYQSSQFRYVMIWKSIGTQVSDVHGPKNDSSLISNTYTVMFDAGELAGLVIHMYLEMFQDESFANRLQTSPSAITRKPYEYYTRASLVAILRLIKNSGQVDWECFIQQFLNQLMNDRTLNMGTHYAQELFLHLYFLGLSNIPDFEPDLQRNARALQESAFRNWKNIPSVLCVTLIVPRKKISLFEKAAPEVYGSPTAHLILQSSDGRQNIFPDIQFGFGHVNTFGERFTENFELRIQGDDREWEGTASLTVSVVVPTWIILLYLDLSTEVVFALKSTPLSMMKLATKLGLLLTIHQSTLASKDVFITRHRPNMSGHISICPPMTCQEHNLEPVPSPGRSSEPNTCTIKVSFNISLDTKALRFAQLTTHLDVLAPRDQEVLRSGVGVKVKQDSPFKLAICTESRALIYELSLPVPIQTTGGKIRVARKSSWIEFIAPIASPKMVTTHHDSLFPVALESAKPSLRTLNYINLNLLPILELKDTSRLKWLNPHVSSMFSASERQERERLMNSGIGCQNVRVDFKDSLFSLFMHFTGVESEQRHSVFGLYNSTHGGFHIVIFVSALRLDTSNQSVVLDAAVIPFRNEIMRELYPLLEALETLGIMKVKVNDDELLLWKYALPVFVERCRDWEHTSICEYKTKGKIPVSVGFGERIVCSCGEGKFSKSYRIEKSTLWPKVSAHAVRVAIPPCFPVPFVEKPIALADLSEEGSIELVSDQIKKSGLKEGSCFVCGRKEVQGEVSLLSCGRCKVVRYCSKQCQVKDWKEGDHKRICRTLRQKD